MCAERLLSEESRVNSLGMDLLRVSATVVRYDFGEERF